MMVLVLILILMLTMSQSRNAYQQPFISLDLADAVDPALNFSFSLRKLTPWRLFRTDTWQNPPPLCTDRWFSTLIPRVFSLSLSLSVCV